MDLKFVVLVCVVLGYMETSVSGLIECYSCHSYSRFVHNNDCEKGEGAKRSACKTCGKQEYVFDIRYREHGNLTWLHAEDIEGVIRTCETETFPETMGCNDYKDYANKRFPVGVVEFLSSYGNDLVTSFDKSEVTVTSISGDVCICDDNLCNGATMVTASMTMVTIIMAAFLLQ